MKIYCNLHTKYAEVKEDLYSCVVFLSLFSCELSTKASEEMNFKASEK